MVFIHHVSYIHKFTHSLIITICTHSDLMLVLFKLSYSLTSITKFGKFYFVSNFVQYCISSTAEKIHCINLVQVCDCRNLLYAHTENINKTRINCTSTILAFTWFIFYKPTDRPTNTNRHWELYQKCLSDWHE